MSENKANSMPTPGRTNLAAPSDASPPTRRSVRLTGQVAVSRPTTGNPPAQPQTVYPGTPTTGSLQVEPPVPGSAKSRSVPITGPQTRGRRATGPIAVAVVNSGSTENTGPSLPVRPAWAVTLGVVSLIIVVASSLAPLLPTSPQWRQVQFLFDVDGSRTVHDWWTTVLMTLGAVFAGAAGAAASTLRRGARLRRRLWRTVGVCLLLVSAVQSMVVEPRLVAWLKGWLPFSVGEYPAMTALIGVIVVCIGVMISRSTRKQIALFAAAAVFLAVAVLVRLDVIHPQTPRLLLELTVIWCTWVSMLLLSLGATLERRYLNDRPLATPRTLTREVPQR